MKQFSTFSSIILLLKINFFGLSKSVSQLSLGIWTSHSLDCNIRTGRPLDFTMGPCGLQGNIWAKVCTRNPPSRISLHGGQPIGGPDAVQEEHGAGEEIILSWTFFFGFEIANIFSADQKRFDSLGVKSKHMVWKTSGWNYRPCGPTRTPGEASKDDFPCGPGVAPLAPPV